MVPPTESPFGPMNRDNSHSFKVAPSCQATRGSWATPSWEGLLNSQWLFSSDFWKVSCIQVPALSSCLTFWIIR
ncbi:mCG67123 [Mus musculus]|nr:mCG67123 [Mus musculus]